MIDFNSTGVTGIWGGRGSGKTTLAKTQIMPHVAKRTIVVIDPMSTTGYATAADAAEAMYDGAKQITLANGTPDTAVALIYAAWQWSHPDKPVYLVCDEAPAYLARSTDNLGRVMFQGRHRALGILILGQRPAAVSAELRSQIEQTLWMRLSDHVDLSTAQKTIGPDQAARLQNFKPGEFIQHPPAANINAAPKGAT